MLVDAPPLAVAVPAFLDFAAGCVLVAHNAPYDVSFLKGACARLGGRCPTTSCVDTARLARAALLRDEVRNCKLGTLARALPLGHHPRPPRAVRRARHGRRAARPHRPRRVARRALARGARHLHLAGLAGAAPQAPPRRGPARLPRRLRLPRRPRSRALRRQVRARSARACAPTSPRPRPAPGWPRWSASPTASTPSPCATPLEAEVRELRLIAELAPRYNRRSRHPERAVWVKLTVEAFPRLSVVREVKDDVAAGAAYLGPVRLAALRARGGRGAAGRDPAAHLHGPASRRGARSARACSPRWAAAPHRASAPSTSRATHPLAEAARRALTDDVREVETRAARAAGGSLPTTCASRRPRCGATGSTPFARGAARAQEIAALAAMPELVAARPTADRGWEVHVVRHGRLAAAATVAPGVDPRPAVAALVATAERVEPAAGPVPCRARRGDHADPALARVPTARGSCRARAPVSWSSPAYGAAGLRRPARGRTARRRRPAARPATAHLRPAG